MSEKLVSAIGILVFFAMPLQTFQLGDETGGPQFRKLFEQPGLSVRWFLASFIIMPGLAIALDVFEKIPNALWVGLALMSMAPPAPPAVRRILKSGNRDIGLAWQAEAFLLSVIMVPLTVYVITNRLHLSLNLSFGPVLLKSVLFYGAPMLAGLLVRRFWPRSADAMVKPLGVLVAVTMGLLLLLVAIVGVPVILTFGISSTLFVVFFVAVAIVVAHLFGGPHRDLRVTLAAMLAARFPLPALILAQANGAVKLILPVILVYIIAGVILVPLYARLTATMV